MGDPRAVGPLLDLFQRTDDDYLKKSIFHVLENSNPIHLYSFIENQLLQYLILNVLCHFSTNYNIRFFKDKIVLPGGGILYTGTEHQREHSAKKLEKIIKL
ncbi:MAG: hypothetical protein AYK19_22535 [Theionarchaea archaeon DG-70-1]|nr:MAG: hypothetical protein AYK19_22535 [Theionarchaea archaeon DG-70-1]